MNADITPAPEGPTCRLNGALTFADYDVFRSVVRELTSSAGKSIAVDLGKTEMIDSAGVGMLLYLNDEAKRTGKALRLFGATGAVQRTLAVLKIDKLVTVSP